MSDFWDEMGGAFGGASSIDEFLSGRDAKFSSVRALTDEARRKSALALPVEAGTRVRFISNMGSVLSYDSVPDADTHGTVVTVKTGAGKTTELDGNVFVLWDDGKFRAINAEHLRKGSKAKKGSSVRMVVSDLGDLTNFFSHVAGSPDELIHKATKDLWSFRQEEGQFVIERLFKDNGDPLKV